MSIFGEMQKKVAEAQNELRQYSEEQVKFVIRCKQDILEAISDYYCNDDYNIPIGTELSEIKRDWVITAIEDELMTEEEFEAILDLLDIIDLELAHSVC